MFRKKRTTHKTIIINRENSADNSAFKHDKIKGKRIFAFIIIVIFSIFCMIGIGIKFLVHMYDTLPSPKELSTISPSLVTKVLGVDSSIIHEFSIERRFWVSLTDIPNDLQQAVVAIEDRRFYFHWGIDLKRIFGAAIGDIISGDYAQGASTLTQQLARNVYLTQRKTIIRKIREILTAIQLESYYTKNEIMELYLNMVYLGAGVYGVEAASQRYFSKSAKDLNLIECATLAGCIQLPERYRPDKLSNIKRTTKRRNLVLHSMVKTGYLEKKLYTTFVKKPIVANPSKKRAKKAPYFVEMVRQYMEKRYGEDKLYNGGLTIYTTLDPIAQDSTDWAVSCHLDSLQRRTNRMFVDSTKAWRAINVTRGYFLDNFDSLYAFYVDTFKTVPDSHRLRIVQASVVALDVQTGAIRVMVGGRNFNESKFNRVIQARRQPGSSFKPFVYTVAINSDYTPATIVMDQPITLETPEGLWRPENYDRKFYGPVTIRNALKKSINLVAIQVLRDVGIQNVINYARNVGLKHRLSPVPALAIGACEATNIEMTSAYSVYPAGGYQAIPYCIERIYDRHQRLIEEHVIKRNKKLSPQTAFLMADMLSTVVKHGTGASVGRRGFTRPAGGKTGTTNDYSDAWFVGFTPQIACGVWVGIDERRSMGHGVTGGRGAIPIWVNTMKNIHRNLPIKNFDFPNGISRKNVCTKTHKLATDYCPEVFEEYFNCSIPFDTCDVHLHKGTRKKTSIINRLGKDRSVPISKDKAVKNSRSLIF